MAPAARRWKPRTTTRERDRSVSIVVGGHTRIRPFNTRDTYPEQNLDNDLCQAVRAGNTIYVRGQIGQNLDTSESVGMGFPGMYRDKRSGWLAMTETGGSV